MDLIAFSMSTEKFIHIFIYLFFHLSIYLFVWHFVNFFFTCKESDENSSQNPNADKEVGETIDSTQEQNLVEEVLQFNTICDQCSKPSKTKMKVTEIPHFKVCLLIFTISDVLSQATLGLS